MDTVQGWQYKTVLTNDLSETTLLERLNHEGSDGWELVTVQAVVQQGTPEVEGPLPGLASHDLTGDYLLVFKKLQS